MKIDPRDIVSAEHVEPDGTTEYVVVWCHNHPTLPRRAEVVVLENTDGGVAVLFCPYDKRLHRMKTEDGHYVMLCPKGKIYRG
jgi:hypothetical protein